MNRRMCVLLTLGLLVACSAALAQDDQSETLGALVSLLKDSDDPQFQLDILKGMNDALKGRTGVKMPAGWQEIAPKLAQSPNAEVKNLAQSLSTLFGDQGAMEKLKAIVSDAKADAGARKRALQSLLEAKAAGLAPALQQWVNDPAVRADALKGLAAYEDAKTPEVVLKVYPSLKPEEKLAALGTLASREEYAAKLLEALKSGAVAKNDLTAATIRQLAQLNNEPINEWIKSAWGEVRTTPEDKVNEIAKLKQALADAEKKQVKTDLSQGRAVFARTCGQCHILFGEGGKVGPDLTGSGRADADYVLTNVVDPNAVIGKDYQMMMIRMKGKGRAKEGRLVNGIITAQDDVTVTVATDTETLILPKEEVLRMKQSDISMMPEGLLSALTEAEFLNFMAYMRSPEQVPLPPDFQLPAVTPAAQ